MDVEDRLRDAFRVSKDLPADFAARTVDRLPDRTSWPRWPAVLRSVAAGLAILLIGVFIGVAALSGYLRRGDASVSAPSVPPTSTSAIEGPSPRPTGAALATLDTADPRYRACYGGSQPELMAFELARARDYLEVFPNMGYSPGLHVDDPAFVVVFDGAWRGATTGTVPRPTPPPRPPGTNDVCIWLAGFPTLYGEVDTSRASSMDLDGFPRSIDGEHVFRSDALRAWIDEATDDTSFLAGGWLGTHIFSCVHRSPLSCTEFHLAGEPDEAFVKAVYLAPDDNAALLSAHPRERVVVRGHVRDKRAAECPVTVREVCERAIVIEELVWTESGDDLQVFEGSDFTFAYTASWGVISEYVHAGLHGPTLHAAVGTGRFDLGCLAVAPSGESEGGVTCSRPTWGVDADEVVLVYRTEPFLGAPSLERPFGLRSGERLASVDGRPAGRSDGIRSVTWRLAGDPSFIEARWGADLGDEGLVQVERVVASWHWRATASPIPQPSSASQECSPPAPLVFDGAFERYTRYEDMLSHPAGEPRPIRGGSIASVSEAALPYDPLHPTRLPAGYELVYKRVDGDFVAFYYAPAPIRMGETYPDFIDRGGIVAFQKPVGGFDLSVIDEMNGRAVPVTVGPHRGLLTHGDPTAPDDRGRAWVVAWSDGKRDITVHAGLGRAEEALDLAASIYC